MKIAVICDPDRKIGPDAKSGSVSFVYQLCEELYKRNHEVTLFASGDSRSNVKISPLCEVNLEDKFKNSWDDDSWHGKKEQERNFIITQAMVSIVENRDDYDLIHDNTHFAIPLLFQNLLKKSIIQTMHFPYYKGIETLEAFYLSDNRAVTVAISNSSRNQGQLNWIGTVYNGIDIDKFTYKSHAGDYLVFLGTIKKVKGAKEAIQVAKKTGEKLIIAGNLEDKEYYSEYIEPHLKKGQIEYIGQVGEKERDELLGGAKALLFPISWEESFGLVMAESMACGTPVVAFRRGAVPEVIIDKVVGYIVDPGDIDGMVRVVKRINKINRKACRDHVIKNFTIKKMVDNYENIYRKAINVKN